MFRPRETARFLKTSKNVCALGRWLKVNGEAIYGTQPWAKTGESVASEAGDRESTGNLRYTTKDGVLYAFLATWPKTGEVTIASLPEGGTTGAPTAINLLGTDGGLKFTQETTGLKIQLPATDPGDGPYALRIAGLNLK